MYEGSIIWETKKPSHIWCGFFFKEQEGQAGPTGIYLNKVKKQQSKSTKHGEVAEKKHSKELRKGR